MMTDHHPSGLHVHSFGWHDGHLTLECGTATGRSIHIELEPSDYPQLLDSFQGFVKSMLAAAETAMLDMVGLRGSAPSSPAELERLTECYLCGFPVTTAEPVGVKVYCVDHHGTT